MYVILEPLGDRIALFFRSFYRPTKTHGGDMGPRVSFGGYGRTEIKFLSLYTYKMCTYIIYVLYVYIIIRVNSSSYIRNICHKNLLEPRTRTTVYPSFVCIKTEIYSTQRTYSIYYDCCNRDAGASMYTG